MLVITHPDQFGQTIETTSQVVPFQEVLHRASS
jgi:hypothetical protein